jgi:hypothetical protein
MSRLAVGPLSALAAILACTACAPKPVPVPTYKMGDKAVVGDLVYAAFDTQWLTEIGEGVTARVPQHRFLLVRVSITNSGSAPLVTPNFSVVDDKGNSYEELSDGQGVPQWIGFLRQIAGSGTSQGNLLFDVPPQHYKLQVGDATGQATALIDLPLDFTTDQIPNLSIPPAGKM